MVNIDDFVKRLEIILDYYALNASSFADKIGVQRSSMSHLLSGRNKPSLDFVLKILDVFPDVDLYWILNGKGSFPKNEQETVNSKVENNVEIEKPSAPIPYNENEVSKDLFSGMNKKEESQEKRYFSESKNSNPNLEEGEIEKIVFFYKNGTFKVYNP
ncbi:helix-turn-helix transcriptional regulator [Flavobacterium pectinovorum]|uniref:helix-turn-helix transcriptional regulator n=1 Tax=Flavobacterium pectinovorum TaxID=29533 RepID=UPI00265DE395|nr:helix-turn-helix transcriptional regulator [Flavobacterium pectinovorum]WKL49154.1 helix-turn-helix transcriptional regulator [Flavobacterium pectinovorum]